MKTSKIYKYTNSITGMSYIGQTCKTLSKRAGHNMRKYRSCEKFWEAIETYGTDCWTVEILWDGLTLDEANIYEQIAIRDNETLYPYGYNLSLGGLNTTHSEKTIRKISEGKKGKKNPMFGKTHSVKWRREHSERMSGENHPMFKKTHSVESRQKMSEAQKGEKNHGYGKTMSDDQRRKRSEKLKGRVFSKETIRKNSDARRKPEYFEAKWFFFLLLPPDMPIRGKHKHLYAKYPNIKEGTIRYWVRQWQSAETQVS